MARQIRGTVLRSLAVLWIVMTLSLLAASCSNEEGAEPSAVSDLEASDGAGDLAADQSSIGARALVDHASWEQSVRADPLGHSPAAVDCPEAAWGLEVNVLEIDTGGCNYLSLVQPSLEAVAAGEEVVIFLTHFPLWAENPAEAHVALLVDDELIWEETVPIPSPSGLLEGTWIAPDEIPKGTSIRFHLHNHGTNSWSLVGIEARPP